MINLSALRKAPYKFHAPNKLKVSTPMYVVLENSPYTMMTHVYGFKVPSVNHHCFFDWDEAVKYSRKRNKNSSDDFLFFPIEWHEVPELFPTHVRSNITDLLSLRYVTGS